MATKPLKRSTIYTYGLLGVPLAMFGYPIGIWLPTFYAGELGISLGAVAGMLFMARFIDVITDPLTGFASDHIKTRWGRRKPFLAVGLPIIMLGVFMVFMPRYLVSEGMQPSYLFMAITVMYLGITLVFVPYGAWGAELSGAYHERSRITASREFFVLIGLLVAASVPFAMEILGRTGLVPIMDAMAWSILIVLPICGIFILWRVPEPQDVPIQRTPFMVGIKALLRNKPMLYILIIAMIVTGGEAFRNALSLFFMRDYMGSPSIGIPYLFYFAAGLLAIPGWLIAGRKFGKHRAFAVCLVCVAIISTMMYFLSFGQLVPFYILFILKGACFGGLQFLPMAMLADVVDVDTADTGSSRAGVYFAISGMAVKISAMFGTTAALAILGAIHFNPGGASVTNTPEALGGLAFNYAIVPAIFFMGALFLTWTFPLTEEIQKHLRDKIEADLHGTDPID